MGSWIQTPWEIMEIHQVHLIALKRHLIPCHPLTCKLTTCNGLINMLMIFSQWPLAILNIHEEIGQGAGDL